ncbi:hypothetical protein FRC06_011687 [Ceratobasidium sp. 370]|nr:hypothetical protein FRC06_011687 [Ceratobasidium sp. 370]
MSNFSKHDISAAMSSLQLSENSSASMDPEMAVIPGSTEYSIPAHNPVKKEDEELVLPDEIDKKDNITVIILPKRDKYVMLGWLLLINHMF